MSGFDEWKQSHLDTIEAIGKELDKDGDWLPVIVYERQGLDIGVLPLVGMGGQEGLPLVTAALAKIQPTRIARIEMGWAANFVEGSEQRPTDRPDRYEVVMAQFCEAGRDGQHELWWATVDRSGEHPRLNEWELVGDFGGAVAEATRLAMATLGRLN